MAGAKRVIHRWEWEGSPPEADTVVATLETLPPVWGVDVADFAEHVLPMSQMQTVYLDSDGNRTIKQLASKEAKIVVWKLYMQVAGRLMMLNQAAEKHGWIVNFVPADAHHVTDSGATIPMPAFRGGDTIVYREFCEIRVVRGEGQGGYLLGRRPGMAALKAGGRVPPWEKVETAARGRAIGAWGFGVLPGSGVASLDEMQMAGPDYQPDADEIERVEDLVPEKVEEALRTAMEQLRVVRERSPEEIGKMVQAYALQISGKAPPLTDDGVLDFSGMPVQQLELLRRRVAANLREVRDLAG